MADPGEIVRFRAQIAALEQMLTELAQTEKDQAARLAEVLDGLRAHERHQAHAAAAMRRQTCVLQSILNSLGSGVIVADEAGRFVHFNAAAERIVGVGMTDGSPDQWTERYGCYLPDQATPYPPRDLPLARAIRGEEVDDAEMFIRNAARPQGVWVSINARPLRDGTGAAHGGVIVLVDITERKRVEQALRESDERLNLALRSAGVGTWNWSIPDDVLIWDDYIHPLFGLEPGTSPGRFADFLARLHSEDRDRVAHEVADAVVNNARYDAEIRVVWPDGSVHDLACRGRVDHDARGVAVRMAGVCWDITRRKHAERRLAHQARELARSNAELEQFAYVASHDLQEPLRMVASYVQLLERRYRGRLDADADDFIAFAVDGATRMQTLINDLLAYSRVGTRGRPAAATDSATALEHALANLTIAIGESDAVVTHDPLPVVPADATQLTQVFQNLVSNAMKFRGPDPPRIHVAAERRGGEWVFSVRDNGIGVDPRHAERIFRIFQRLHGRSEYPGTGIGLALCKRIVERHGGRIWVESPSDRGSVFCFTLPAERGDPHE